MAFSSLPKDPAVPFPIINLPISCRWVILNIGNKGVPATENIAARKARLLASCQRASSKRLTPWHLLVFSASQVIECLSSGDMGRPIVKPP